jgi:hypothetical protein
MKNENYFSGFQGKDAMREKAQRLMKGELSARDLNRPVCAMPRNQRKKFKKGGEVGRSHPRMNESTAGASGFHGKRNHGKKTRGERCYAKGGYVQGYADGGFVESMRNIPGRMREAYNQMPSGSQMMNYIRSIPGRANEAMGRTFLRGYGNTVAPNMQRNFNQRMGRTGNLQSNANDFRNMASGLARRYGAQGYADGGFVGMPNVISPAAQALHRDFMARARQDSVPHYANGGFVGGAPNPYGWDGDENNKPPFWARVPGGPGWGGDEGGVPGGQPAQTPAGGRRSPDEVQEGPVPDWLQAQRDAEAKKAAANAGGQGGGGNLGYNYMPQNDRPMGFRDRMRLGANQAAGSARYLAGRAGQQLSSGARSAYDFARRMAPQAQRLANTYAPQAQQALNRLGQSGAELFGRARRSLGFKKGGQVGMAYREERDYDHMRGREERMPVRSRKAKAIKPKGMKVRKKFAAGGVGKIRHHQADKHGNPLSNKRGR